MCSINIISDGTTISARLFDFSKRSIVSFSILGLGAVKQDIPTGFLDDIGYSKKKKHKIGTAIKNFVYIQ